MMQFFNCFYFKARISFHLVMRWMKTIKKKVMKRVGSMHKRNQPKLISRNLSNLERTQKVFDTHRPLSSIASSRIAFFDVFNLTSVCLRDRKKTKKKLFVIILNTCGFIQSERDKKMVKIKKKNIKMDKQKSTVKKIYNPNESLDVVYTLLMRNCLKPNFRK